MINLLLKTGALKFGDFTLASGKKSNYYIDIKRFMLNSEGMKLAAYQLACIIYAHSHEHVKIDAIGGPELGAVALVGGVLDEYEPAPMDGFIIRKKPKEYGTKSLIEISTDKPKLNVAIIEDVITTGKSTLHAINVLREAGHNPVLIVSVVDREDGAKEEFDKLEIPFRPLITAREILHKAETLKNQDTKLL